MDETVLAAHEVHERTEVDEVDDLAGVDLADFGFLDDAENPLLGGFDLRQVGRGDLDDAFVVDVDLGAGFSDDFADDLAAGADDFADLRLVDRDRFDARRVRRQLGTGVVERLGHFAEDVRTAFAGLCERDLHDLFGDARDLDVHLKAGDAFRGAGYLEVHVAEVIFIAKDVADDREFLAFEDQAHGDARNRALQRNARVHHRQRTAAHRCHRRRAVGLGDVGQHADGVGEFFLRRQNGVQRAPGELAVADFATAGGAETTDFTDRIGREVVVEHEMLVTQAGQAVDHLLGVLGAKRGGADRLGFAAGEQRRTMGARQEADGRLDRTDLRGVAAVDAAAFLQDCRTDDFRFQLLDQLDRGHLVLRGFLGKGFLRLGAGGVQRVRTLGLVGQLVRCLDVLADQLLQLVLGGREICLCGHFPGFLGGLFGQLDDRVDHGARMLVREHNSAEHGFFRKLLGFGFNHHHRVLRGGDDEVEVTGGNLFVGRVEDIFAVDITDACGADRAHEGHARNRQRGRCGNHRQNIGFVLAVIAHDLSDNVDLVVETFGEKRADRAIDQTRNQRLLFGRAALTLEETARNAAGSRIFFLVVDGEGEEVLAFLHRTCGRDGAEHYRFAKRREHRAIGLTGNAARFERQGLAAPLDFDFFRVEHLFSLHPATLCGRGLCVGAGLAPLQRKHLPPGRERRRIAPARKKRTAPQGGRPFYLRRPSFAIRFA